MTRPKLTLLPDLKERALSIAAEIHHPGLRRHFEWDDPFSDEDAWRGRAREYLDSILDRAEDSTEALKLLASYWRLAFRQHCARFLEMRAQVYAEMGDRRAAEVLLLHASAVAHKRSLDTAGDFRDRHLDAVGRCPECLHVIRSEDWTGKIEPVLAGERPGWGRALYSCPGCKTTTRARGLRRVTSRAEETP